MSDNSDAGTRLRVHGQEIPDPPLPRFMGAGARSAGAAADPFLPPGLVKVARAVDLSARSRAAGPAEGHLLEAGPGQVVVLELSEDVTIITTPDRLRETLERVNPEALKDGAIDLDALRARGTPAARGRTSDAVGALITRAFTLDIGTDAIITAAKRKALEWLGRPAEDKLEEYAGLGVTWVGTKALMWAIESRLDRKPGLYRWTGTAIEQAEPFGEAGDPRLESDARQGPLLVFIHGTASSTTGSFGDLPVLNPDDWKALASRFGDRIYAFEHRTLSESPIDNALALARALPAGAQLNVVTHSRGGLVGDFLCLSSAREDFGDALIGSFREGDAAADGPRSDRERAQAYAEHREALRALRSVLGTKRFLIDRYVRVASPARGTRLAGSNLDVFLSSLLTLIGTVPQLAGNPIYSAFKRVVIEIARNRTDPHLVPGIDAMLPDSPTARFLATAKPSAGTHLAVISGDIEGGGLLKRLGVLFTDSVFFDRVDNDLVVDTDSMYAGLARPGLARRRFERGPKVSHFRYFENPTSRAALRDWLTKKDVAVVTDFEPMPDPLRERALSLDQEKSGDAALIRSRGGQTAGLPVVVVLPGTMGSHLWIKSRQDRVWLDPADLALGGLDRIGWSAKGVTAEKLFDLFYGDFCRHLLATHRVERFAYDWRQPLDRLADDLAKCLEAALASTSASKQAVRIVAHSAGGLVVRALIEKRRDLWDQVMTREGARFIMLGTPNHGSHSMVATLLGKGEAIRMLARVDQKHDMQGVLDIVAQFRGALQVLPRPGFQDTGGTPQPDYYDAREWARLKEGMRDRWFGDKVAAVPNQSWLDDGKWLWDRKAALPLKYKTRTIYVRGSAPNTICGVKLVNGEWKLVGTPRGDGTVTWLSGDLAGIGSCYLMPVEHGALADSEDHFPALVDLLERGETTRLNRDLPAERGAEAPALVTCDPGPVPYPTGEELARSLLGARPRARVKAPPAAVLEVSCAAMDLRFTTRPVMVGHYEQDAISGAEALIDRELVGNELTMRHHLGLYAAAPGTATVVLIPRNEEERLRGSHRGAVVIGLGKYGDLTVSTLTEAVRLGTLRYLLQLLDRRAGQDEEPTKATLATLLLGHNSTTNITIEDSVDAIIRGVLGANQQFRETMRRDFQVTQLEFLELYLDTAIGAARTLKPVAGRVNADATRYGMRVEAAATLRQEKGWRQRLDPIQAPSYWPRLIVAEAERRDDERVPGDARPGTAPPPKRTALAPRLKFVYLGERARAETELLQTQPNLVAELVKKAAQAAAYSEDFSRSLFHLLMPLDFKNTARQMQRIVLVVDDRTANLPWELMLVEATPLAVQTAMVRQLASPRYRARVRQTLDDVAYVVGNPSTEGFYNVFEGLPAGGRNQLEPLEAAETEAVAVAELLRRHRHEVVEAIGDDQTSLDVINKLFRRSYRIVHVAAHGVFDQKTKDGSTRSGVVLSDGMLITAAEIGAMEAVPDLVFLNCCHLGTVDRGPIAFNRLAYSLARELVEIGVRAVVVAGWAVNDAAANLFAATFYEELLTNRPFGDAVFRARQRTYESYRDTNTWGAYQAYGDPGYLLNPRRSARSASGGDDWTPVAPDELVERLRRIQVEAASETLSPDQARHQADAIQRLLGRSPDGTDWDKQPQVAFALGQAYAELGSAYFKHAREYYLAAIGPEDTQGRAPIRAIEQLANLEARTGEETDNASLIRTALKRLQHLERMVRPGAAGEASAGNAERAALVGSAHRRLAAMHARAVIRIVGKPGSRESAADLERSWTHFNDALARGLRTYQAGEGKAGDGTLRPYNALTRLALKAVIEPGGHPDEDIALARTCAQCARRNYAKEPTFWNAVMPAEALLTESLLDGSLRSAGKRGDDALAAVKRAYGDALAHARGTARERDSVVKHVRLLALFFEARSAKARGREPEARVCATRLLEIAGQLGPGGSDSGTTSEQPPSFGDAGAGRR